VWTCHQIVDYENSKGHDPKGNEDVVAVGA